MSTPLTDSSSSPCPEQTSPDVASRSTASSIDLLDASKCTSECPITTRNIDLREIFSQNVLAKILQVAERGLKIQASKRLHKCHSITNMSIRVRSHNTQNLFPNQVQIRESTNTEKPTFGLVVSFLAASMLCSNERSNFLLTSPPLDGTAMIYMKTYSSAEGTGQWL